MSADFWWGVVAATGAWLSVAGTSTAALAWLVTRQARHEQQQ